MKLIVLAFMLVLSIASADVKPGDFREEFDQLLAEWASEKIAEGERFLLHLSEQIDELRKKPNKEEQEKIIVELDLVLAHLHATNHYLAGEVKRTDLNTVEKTTFDMLYAGSAALIKDLQAAEKEVKAMH